MQKVYTKIESIVGNVITVRAEGVRNQDLAEITTAQGTGYANVIKLDGDKVSDTYKSERQEVYLLYT